MVKPFYKSLDREFELFGIKGRWVRIFLMSAGASILLGVLAGSVSSSGVGVVTAIVCVAVSFFACLTLQSRLPGRQVGKAMISGKVPGWVLRRETLSRILLEDGRYAAAKSGRDGGSVRNLINETA